MARNLKRKPSRWKMDALYHRAPLKPCVAESAVERDERLKAEYIAKRGVTKCKPAQREP